MSATRASLRISGVRARVGPTVIEVREPDKPPRRVTVDGQLEVGREGTGLVVADPAVSRRHLRLDAGPAGLTVTDLGSRNGSSVNGVPLTGTVRLSPRDVVRLGATVLEALVPPPAPVRLTQRGALGTSLGAAPGAHRVVEIAEPNKETRRVNIADQVEVGREGAGLGVDDPTVSRRHLRLEAGPAGLTVTDLGSRNGTTVDGAAITGPTLVTAGQVVGLGTTTLTVVSTEAPQPPGRAEPSPTWTEGYVAPIPEPAFPNYLQMPRRVPAAVWHGFRAVTVVAFLIMVATLVVRPAGGLFVFWRIIVPVLPLIFVVAPGFWRNVCPLAATNQLPRLLSWSRQRPAPAWLRERGYVVAVMLFLAIVVARRAVFNDNGPALAALLVVVLAGAFAGGLVFKGKSGWCSSICPMLPVQRLYGQTPFLTLPNSHCQPCVGCTKNCYDFNPGVAFQADLHDRNPEWSAPRKLFAGAFPGLIVAYFTLPEAVSIAELYLRSAAYVLTSAGSFFALDAVLRISTPKLAATYGAVALNLFYWYSAVPIADAVGQVGGWDAAPVIWPLRAAVLVVSLAWLARTFRTERRFVAEAVTPVAVQVAPTRAGRLSQQLREGTCEVRFEPQDRRVVTSVGATLLDVAESDGLPIEAGCRMGMCGADPVAVLDGASNLSPVTTEEASTLRRLGLAENTRMACCAAVSGNVSVSLSPDRARSRPPSDNALAADASIRSVVVIGNGIAGVTAADFVRRNHPDCEIHVVGREPHPLYNRMGISRLIYGRSAMGGLYLLGDSWYEDQRVTCWLNTKASAIDVGAGEVTLGTGEGLHYDRLILAMGASSFVPPIEGIGGRGSFVLREAGDAIAIRAYVQETMARSAVVAGGGLLGLEAAYALHQLGLGVTVLERSDRLLSRQVDERCSQLLTDYLENVGIGVLHRAEATAIAGSGQVERVLLGDGTEAACEMLLVCAGVRPNVELARSAGIAVNRGVVVDDGMRTSVAGVYAAGDVAEQGGASLGLWPTAVGQAEVAAVNALGGELTHSGALPPVILKGVGIDLVSVGQVAGGHDREEVIVREDGGAYAYGKLVVADGRLVGAILLGIADLKAPVLAAVKAKRDVRDRLTALRAGHWEALTEG